MNSASLALLEQIVPHLPGYAYLLNEKGCYICCNPSQAKAFGLKNRVEVAGKKNENLPVCVKYPEFEKIWEDSNSLAMHRSLPLQFNEPSLNLTGEILNLEYLKIPLIANKKLIGLLVITLDDKNSIFSIEQQKSKDIAFKSILDNLPEHVYWKDKDGKYLGCNLMQAKDLNLKSSEEIIGKTDYDLSPKDKADAFRKIDEKIIIEGKMLEIEEIVSKDGENKIVLSKKIPFFDEDQKIIGLLGISVDITERKENERIAAEVANEAKSEFIRNMEHQLRTPFSGVYCLVETLFQLETDPTKKELLEITYQSAKEFLDLLNNIIDFSRNPLDSSALLAKKFDLRQTLDSVVTMEKAAAVFKNLKINYSYPEDIPTIFIGDPNRVHRLVLNLLSNAIKFTAEGSVSLQLRLAKQIDEKNLILQIIITDTGIGIAEEKQQYIYEKFYRLHPANQNKYTGAGLGLYVVKQIIEDLGGEIEVKSQSGKGSTFVCTLPLKRPLLDEMIESIEE